MDKKITVVYLSHKPDIDLDVDGLLFIDFEIGHLVYRIGYSDVGNSLIITAYDDDASDYKRLCVYPVSRDTISIQ